MEVTKKLTPYNFTSKNDKNRIKYIVVHYFGGLSTAENLLDYWHRQYVGASAHYIVGHDGKIYQSVSDASRVEVSRLCTAISIPILLLFLHSGCT